MKYPFNTTTFAALCLLCGSLATGAASAATCTSASTSTEQSLQSIIDGITVGGSSSITTNTDCLDNSALWEFNATGTASTSMVIEISAYDDLNEMGIYDPSDGEMITLYTAAASAGDRVSVDIDSAGSVVTYNSSGQIDTGDLVANLFGFYLTSGSGTTYYSDSSKNPDGSTQMLAYQGNGTDLIDAFVIGGAPWSTNEYLLAWEDLPSFVEANGNGLTPAGAVTCPSSGGGDCDFNDLVVMVESVQPIPVPAAVWLFGSGLLGLVGIARRRKA